MFSTHLSISARRSFCRRPVRHAVTRTGVKAEQLSAHPIIFLQDKQINDIFLRSQYCAYTIFTHETGAGPSVLSALGVQSQQFSWQHPGQRLVFVRRIEQTCSRVTAVRKIKSLLIIIKIFNYCQSTYTYYVYSFMISSYIVEDVKCQ